MPAYLEATCRTITVYPLATDEDIVTYSSFPLRLRIVDKRVRIALAESSEPELPWIFGVDVVHLGVHFKVLDIGRIMISILSTMLKKRNGTPAPSKIPPRTSVGSVHSRKA